MIKTLEKTRIWKENLNQKSWYLATIRNGYLPNTTFDNGGKTTLRKIFNLRLTGVPLSRQWIKSSNRLIQVWDIPLVKVQIIVSCRSTDLS